MEQRVGLRKGSLKHSNSIMPSSELEAHEIEKENKTNAA